MRMRSYTWRSNRVRKGVAVEAAALAAMLEAVDTDHEAFIYTSGGVGVW